MRWWVAAAAALTVAAGPPSPSRAPASGSAPPSRARAPASAPAPCATNPLCVCRGDHLACSHVPFHRFPETDDSVWHVAVSQARLGALEEAALDARRLRTLVLVACRLHRLDAAALASMENTLASLDLGYNEFTELPLEAIRELKVLNWLNLQNNFISEIDPIFNWGYLTESLSSLSLSNNQVSVLKSGALSSLRHLTQLELDGNRVRILDPTALPPALVLLRLSDNLLTQLPCPLNKLPRLRHLHLRNNLIRSAVDSFCHFENNKIDALDLSHNELSDPFEFQFLSKYQLKQLNLDLNDFTTIPYFENSRLEKLSISYNRLIEVADAAIQALKRNLEKLDLDHNELTSLPSSFRELTRLRFLSLAYNMLAELSDLPPHLHSLSLAGNFLTSFPPGLRGLEPATLVLLDLGYNQLTTIPHDAFGTWAGALTTLNLRGNQLAQLPADVFPATLPVRELALSFNDLYHVDSSAFANLTRLRVLELSSTLFNGEFPLEAVSLDLKWLTLDNNNIHYITTSDLDNFPSLEYLNLDFNKIVKFPSQITNFSLAYKLKELRLSYNYITNVSREFLRELSELQSLDLSYNRLHNISDRCFENLGNLVYLSLAGNDLELIAEKAFYALPKLEVLDLQENRLEEFSLEYFSNVSSEDAAFAVNVSYNQLTSLVGGLTVSINILDLSHNLLESLSISFFEAIKSSIRQVLLFDNRLMHIDNLGFLPKLQILSISNNSINSIKRRAFAEIPEMQILDLSHNKLSQLGAEQFHNNRWLRHLRLASNELRSLPRDCFKNTVLEHLDLADNQLALYPSSALAHVGFTLRHLDLAHNRIEYLDAAMFQATSFLYDLNLAGNALTVLSDNTFASLSRLFRLDLSHNTIKTNFKELFHNLPRLRRLALAGAGLKVVPHLPLMNLTQLDLSENLISSYRETDVKCLINLRNLDIASNKITSLQPSMWTVFPKLTKLDVSFNPLVRITSSSFDGLDRLSYLRMIHLWQLETMDPRSFRSLPSLRSLTLESPAGDVPIADMAEQVQGLESLTLLMRSNVLDTQLHGVRVSKLRVLELKGAALQRVSARAFVSFGRQRSFTLRIRGTGVRALPPGLVQQLVRVPHLALDLSNNQLATLTPATLYPNLTDWNRFATKLLSGGLMVSGNPLRCGCAVSWVGAWLRRWTGEVGGGARDARAAARDAVCLYGDGSGYGSGPRAPRARALLAADTDAARCHASALSSSAPGAPRRPAALPAFLWIILLYSIS
ncbi:hypothetical protein evm_013589 [Chilo suppressalis]|nr:hypothetical protein evm_013589 [Chilo suppressalis]